MKQSQYNFILYTNGYGYWYNALYGSYFRVSEKLSIKIETLLNSNINLLNTVTPNTFKRMADGGFIVFDDINELDTIRKKHLEAVNEKDYFLVILPTLNCNFKCWYCIQDHIPSIMSQRTQNAIIKHIDYMIDHEHIRSLRLDWFGGEPFMFFKKVIVPVNEYAIKKCNACNVQFSSGATTNGYFLTPQVVSRLDQLKIRHFQITLDGEKEFHDKVKFMNGCNSAFDHVLTNINHMLSEDDHITINLRINYTHTTLTDKIVDEVCRHINQGNRKRILISPHKVWQESVDKNFPTILVGIIDKFANNGFCVSRGHIFPSFTPCYVNKKYYNAINYNGHVVKCTACNDLYETMPKGQLMDDGTIQWQDNYDLRCQEATFENERCLACKKLPVCMGLCPRDHLAGLTKCKYDAEDADFEKCLLNFLVHEYND